MNYDELEKLNDLRQRGVISEEEFQQEKEKILNHKPGKNIAQPQMQTNTVCSFIYPSF